MKKIVKLPASLFNQERKIILNFVAGTKIIDQQNIILHTVRGPVCRQIDNNITVSSALDDTY